MTVTFDKLPTIPVFLDAKKLSAGVPAFIGWDTSSTTQHHWLVGGNSGAGKSYSLMLILAKIWKYLPDTARLWLMDFKGSDDFHYLRGIPNARYYFHDRCAVGLQEFGEEMESRLRDNPDRSPVVAVFDEYASFISYTQVMDRSKKPEMCIRDSVKGMLRGFRFANTILILCGTIFVLFLVLGLRKLHKCASLIASLGGAVGLAWYLLESPFFKQWTNSKTFGCVCLIFSIAVLSLGLIYFLQSRKTFNTFNIYHSTGIFSFQSTLYSAEELKNFERQVKALRGSNT